MRTVSFPLWCVAALCGLALPPTALAQAVSTEPTVLLSTSLERVRLPEGEHMGLVGGAVLFGVGGHDWWVGPAVYGAATGQRGGLFVLGAEVQRNWALAPGWAAVATGYLGGGGGGAAPVGSGLMWRGSASLMREFKDIRLGLGVSQVRFPSGQISSNQLALTLQWNQGFRLFAPVDAGKTYRVGKSTGLGVDRLAATGSIYKVKNGGGRIGVVGARAEHQSDTSNAIIGLEASAAATGGAAGYMEIMGTVGTYRPIFRSFSDSLAWHSRLALGLGGGGGVPVNGGIISKWASGVSWNPRGAWAVGAEIGQLRGLGSSLRADVFQLWLAHDLETPRNVAGEGVVSLNEWATSFQREMKAQRKAGGSAPLDTVGLKLNRYQNEYFYVSGQAHSAYAGGAGAYSVGLVGAGLATSPKAAWRAGVEALVGAAGGGGVATGGGLVGQGLGWVGYKPSPENEWRLGAGAMRSLRSQDLRTGVLELSWVRSLGLGGR